MPNPRLAERYAKSLIDLSIERNQLEEVHADVLLLQELCRNNQEFVGLLNSPVISDENKEKVFGELAKGRITETMAEFNGLLARKGRSAFLPEILGTFIKHYKTKHEIYLVKLITAVPVSEELKKVIVDKIAEVTKMKKIELSTEVRPEIVGGLIFEVGDLIVDASIGFDLSKIKLQFARNEYVYQIR